MPTLNVATHTVHAICRHFAHKREFDLDCSHLALAVQSQLPGAKIIHGTAACCGERPEPCSWIRAGGKDYDVQRIAQQRRCNCGPIQGYRPTQLEKELEGTVLGKRFLREREDQTHEFPDTPRGHTGDLEGWSLPSCAACCGRHKGHTLDSGCVSPWKADALQTRALKEHHRNNTWTPFADLKVRQGWALAGAV